MSQDRLTTPAEFLAKGMITQEKMDIQLGLMRYTAEELGKQFPDATIYMDEDDILRVEASEEDAAEIDYELQERVSTFTPFSITIRK